MTDLTHSQVMGIRNRLVSWGYWAHTHRDQIFYAEVRPMPIHDAPGHLPFTTDCSGIVTMFAKWAGAKDPNGSDFSGWGYTGTLLAHLPHIAKNETWRGDLVVFGPGTGIHVVMLLEGGVNTSDPLVASHGHPGADDPSVSRLSYMQTGFPPPTTYLRIVSNGPASPPNPYPELNEGAIGSAVVTLQKALNAHGAKLQVDGQFGPATLAAVKAFQKSHKLQADGDVGPLTWAALRA